ncbi:MAG: copper resistance CopC family protein [Ilumatobacteraceae bacterium]
MFDADRCDRRFARSRAGVVAGIAVLIAAVVAAGAGPAAAHDGIASSDPASGAVIEESIDSVTIDFGADIGDTAQIALLAPDGTQLATTTTVASTTTATSSFDPIEDQGVYTVNYLATSIVDGHVLGGSFSFTYGDASSDTFPPLLFAGIALVILSIGAWFSWRARQRTRVGDGMEAEATSVDVG